jgi:hypothetical protein
MLVHTFVTEILHDSAYIVAKRNWDVVPKSIYMADRLGKLDTSDKDDEEISQMEHEQALRKYGQEFVATWSLGFWLSSVRLNRPGFARSNTSTTSFGSI